MLNPSDYFVFSGFLRTFASDDESQIRLVALSRVLIEKQFIAERRIENGLHIVTPFFLNSPNCLYIKKSCNLLQSYKKSRAEQNKFICFLCRDGVTSPQNYTFSCFLTVIAQIFISFHQRRMWRLPTPLCSFLVPSVYLRYSYQRYSVFDRYSFVTCSVMYRTYTGHILDIYRTYTEKQSREIGGCTMGRASHHAVGVKHS